MVLRLASEQCKSSVQMNELALVSASRVLVVNVEMRDYQ